MKFYIIILILLTSCKIKQDQKKIILNKQELKTLEEIGNSDQKYRKIYGIPNNNLPQNKIDSLRKLQNKIDIKNSNNLIKLIGKYGYLQADNSNINIPLFIMLMHTPQENKTNLQNILNDELKNGNIDKQRYNMIIWHLKGRKGLPVGKGRIVYENGEILKTN